MADLLETPQKRAEGVPHREGHSDAKSGQFGVSDERRAQLAQMEQDAGIQHEAADESVTQRPDRDPQQEAYLPDTPAAARPGDRH